MNQTVASNIKSMELSAIVLNADGTVKKDLGVINYWHRNPIKRAWWRIKRGIRSWLPS